MVLAPAFRIRSPQAIKEFEKMIPSKIDRNKDLKGFNKMALDGFGNNRSNADYLKRRKTYLKLLSLNTSSKYIPDIHFRLKNHLSKWEVGKKYN